MCAENIYTLYTASECDDGKDDGRGCDLTPELIPVQCESRRNIPVYPEALARGRVQFGTRCVNLSLAPSNNKTLKAEEGTDRRPVHTTNQNKAERNNRHAWDVSWHAHSQAESIRGWM